MADPDFESALFQIFAERSDEPDAGVTQRLLDHLAREERRRRAGMALAVGLIGAGLLAGAIALAPLAAGLLPSGPVVIRFVALLMLVAFVAWGAARAALEEI